MAEYQVLDHTTGATYFIEGPDDATEEELQRAAQQHADQQPEQQNGPSVLEQVGDMLNPVNLADSALTTATGALAQIPGAAAYAAGAVGKAFGADVNPGEMQDATANYFTWHPHTQYMQEANAQLGAKIAPVVQKAQGMINSAADSVGKVSPLAGDMIREAPRAGSAALSMVAPASGAMRSMAAQELQQPVQGLRNYVQAVVAPQSRQPAVMQPTTRAQAVQNVDAALAKQNMGAAAANPISGRTSAGLADAVAQTDPKRLNMDVLGRHAQAESLPVPVQLTRGAATGNPMEITWEQNMRAALPALAARMNLTERQLADNLDAFTERAGIVPTTSMQGHGQTLVNAYRAVDRTELGGIDADYNAAKAAAKASGAKLDAGAALSNARTLMADDMVSHYAPPEMGVLESIANSGNGLSWEQYENLRTTLARTMRSASVDGNTKHAAGLLRSALEDIPLTGGDEQTKALFDAARKSSKRRFDAIKADPAYEAALEADVNADKFAERFVLNGSRENLQRMQDRIGSDTTVGQTLARIAVDRLRKAALGTTTVDAPRFSASQYNRTLSGMDHTLDLMVRDPELREWLDTLGDVSRNVKARPAGEAVNNSGTLVGSLARDVGGEALKRVPVVGKHVAPVYATIKNRKRLREALRHGAGIGDEDLLTQFRRNADEMRP